MQITIFLDTEEADYFRTIIPATSAATQSLQRAVRAREYWGADGHEIAVVCDDAEGAELLRYAQSHCPSAVEKIRRAFRVARLRIEGDDRRLRRRAPR